jgi:hypothetical protein
MNEAQEPHRWPLPPWPECDWFCINGYSGSAARACGWRGRSRDIQLDDRTAKLLCPWCGCPTLFRIPPGSPDSR